MPRINAICRIVIAPSHICFLIESAFLWISERRSENTDTNPGRLWPIDYECGPPDETGAVQPARAVHSTSSDRDTDCNSDAWIPAIVKVVTIVLVRDVDVIGVVPVIRPVSRPRVEKRNPIAVVLESWVSTINHEGETVDPKRIPLPKVDAVTVVRDTVGVVAAALLPIAVV